jgi:DNA-directed RNA polymerase specialized sigma24 family protein
VPEPSSQPVGSGSGARRVPAAKPGTESRLVGEAVTAAKGGDLEALHFLYVRFAADVARVVGALVGDRRTAEKLSEEVLADLSAVVEQYEPGQMQFNAWLLRSARKAALSQISAPGQRHAPSAPGPGQRVDPASARLSP